MTAVPEQNYKEITDVLTGIQHAFKVQVLFAAEAGSRAWGFHSPDSDFDVRFIYRHSRLSEYIALDEPQDVIQHMDGLTDCSGWDIKKTLRLARKSNMSLYEWTKSPVQYGIPSLFLLDLSEYIKESYSFKQLAECYRGIAKSTYKQHLAGTGEKTTKKYLYVIRCLLAVNFINDYDEFPPVDFTELYNLLPERINKGIVQELLEQKIQTGEKTALDGLVLKEYLDWWMTREIEFWTEDKMAQIPHQEADTDALNQLLRKYTL